MKPRKGLFKSIFNGVIKAVPVLNTIKEEIKANNSAPVIGQPVHKTDWRAIITEIATVALILAFVFGKITMDDLLRLIGLL